MPVRVNLDGLHVILWQMRAGNGSVRVIQQELADALQITKHTLSRLLARLEDDGRLTRVSAPSTNVNTYNVHDPAGWKR